MPARKNLFHPDRVRKRIRAAMLARRLQKFALGELEQGAPVVLNMREIKAIEILLKKTVPDLTAVEHSGEVVQRDVTDQPLTDAQWSEQYERPLN